MSRIGKRAKVVLGYQLPEVFVNNLENANSFHINTIEENNNFDSLDTSNAAENNDMLLKRKVTFFDLPMVFYFNVNDPPSLLYKAENPNQNHNDITLDQKHKKNSPVIESKTSSSHSFKNRETKTLFDILPFKPCLTRLGFSP